MDMYTNEEKLREEIEKEAEGRVDKTEEGKLINRFTKILIGVLASTNKQLSHLNRQYDNLTQQEYLKIRKERGLDK